jgi:hypothetical protein
MLVREIPRSHVHSLTWSGGNSFAARRKGAEALRDLVKEARLRDPKARQYVIAHSHGGMIAALASRDPVVEAALDGVVCLNTPFLNATLRGGVSRYASGPFVVMCSLFAAAVALFLTPSWFVPDFSPNIFLRIAVSFALVLAGGFAVYSFDEVMERELSDLNVSFPQAWANKVLLVRLARDEASLALTAYQLAAAFLSVTMWLPAIALLTSVNLLAASAAFLESTLGGRSRWLVVIALMSCIAGSLWSFLNGPPYVGIALGVMAIPLLGIIAEDLMVVALTILVFLMIIPAAVMLPVVTLVLLPLGFAVGMDMALRLPIYDVYAEDSPNGTWPVTRMSLQPDLTAGMRHSVICNDPDVHEKITEFISSRERQCSTNPAINEKSLQSDSLKT